jgi:hypothetical protein
MKTQIKNKHGMSFIKCSGKTRQLNFVAEVFSDGSGEFIVFRNKNGYEIAEDDGRINHWIQDIRKKKKIYDNAEQILIKIQQAYKKAKKEKKFINK